MSVLYFSACTGISVRIADGYESVELGDTEEEVIRALGEPSVRESPGDMFLRYASHPCQEPCAERLWFENRLSLDIQAWSIELDEHRRVLDKAQWTSP